MSARRCHGLWNRVLLAHARSHGRLALAHPRYLDRSFTTSTAAPSLLEHLNQRIQSSQLRYDAGQARAAKRLARLQTTLTGYDNRPWIDYHRRRQAVEAEQRKRQEALAKAETNGNDDKANDPEPELPEPPATPLPRGLYLYGPVGTGKSMLMDTFYRLVHVDKKRRCHFHAFLNDVHSRIHALKQADLQEFGRDFAVRLDRNPIERVGEQLSEELSLLCFDEFQVTDVADALILSQLFRVLFRNGIVVVATSNRPPTDLYEGGLNRGYFLPFIALLERHCVVHELQSSTDYRSVMADGADSYYWLTDDTSHEQVSDLVERLRQGMVGAPLELDVGGQRTMYIPDADVDQLVARASFDAVCNLELGASDYRVLADTFQVVVIEDVPRLSLAQHDKARRFITLVDELYEAQAAVLCCAPVPPDELFVNAVVEDLENPTDEDMMDIDQAVDRQGHSVGALASVRELSFAFRRAASRLKELTSPAWWKRRLE